MSIHIQNRIEFGVSSWVYDKTHGKASIVSMGFARALHNDTVLYGPLLTFGYRHIIHKGFWKIP
jgi:hypothetical protein